MSTTKKAKANRRKRPGAYAALGLAAMVIVSFSPAFLNGLVWDDSVFTEDPAVLTVSGLKTIWFSPSEMTEAHYWPLTYTTFWLEHKLWGLAPLGYHIVNVSLYLGTVILLWRLCLRLSVPAAWAAVAIWAVHPLHVESVVWVIERKDILSGLLYLGAALTYMRFTETRQAGRYGLGLSLYALGLLAKSAVVTLPAGLLIWHWWRRGRLTTKHLLQTAPFFAVGLLISLGDMALYRSKELLDLGYSLPERALIAARALWFYVGKLLWPGDLIVIYPLWNIQVTDALAWIYLVGAAALAALLWFGRHRFGRAPLAGMLFFALTLSPSLGFLDYGYMQYSFVADRFQYLAGFGLIAVLVGLASKGVQRLPRRYAAGAPAVLAAVLVLLGTLTWRQARLYRDDLTLFSHIVSFNPSARSAHLNLGVALYEAGRYEESLAAGRKAVEQARDSANAHLNLGLSLLKLNRLEEAEAAFRSALEVDPRHRNSHQNLGETLRNRGRHEEAIVSYREAIEADPAYALAHAGLGESLYQLSRHEEALAALNQSLALDPEASAAGALHLIAGQAARELGRFAESERHFRRAMQLMPGQAAPHLELAVTSLRQDQNEQAEDDLERALNLEPTNARVLDLLALVYFRAERWEDALALLRRSSDIRPTDARTHANVGVTLYRLKRYEEATASLDRALALAPDLPAAKAALAEIRQLRPREPE